MSSDFATVLDECLARLKSGDSISECLERYPEYAEDLEPLLETAQVVEALRYTEPPRSQALARGRQRFLTEAARLREQQQVAERPLTEKIRDFFTAGAAGTAWGRAVAVIIAVLLLFGTVSGIVVQASEGSLPGDTLYSVKRVTRQVQLLTTLNAEARQEKRAQIQAEEREEVRQAADQNREFEKDVAGAIIEWQGGSLVLEDGLHIRVTDTTQIQGQLVTGRVAEVHVRSEDGRLIAEQILVREPPVPPTATPTVTATVTLEPTQTPRPTNTPEPTQPPPTKVIPTDTPKPKVTDTPFPTATADLGEGPAIYELTGPIDSISETVWVVAGQEIQIMPDTVIKGDPAVGRVAHVQANRLDDSFLAIEIEIETPDTPTPARRIIRGVVERKESETVLFVSGQRVRLDDRTEISGELKPGAFVEVEGLQESPTTVFAQKIIVIRTCSNRVPLEGVILSIDPGAGIWIVDGLTVRVDSGVPINGTPAVGAVAQIEACQLEDGSYSAESVFIVPATPTPSPEARETQTTPTPTVNVGSELTPTLTTEPSPTATGAPPSDTTPTMTPSPEARETQTLTPTVGVSSGATPTATVEPSPTATTSPSSNVTPTVTPTAGARGTPTLTPTTGVSSEPTLTPTPTIELPPVATTPPGDATE